MKHHHALQDYVRYAEIKEILDRLVQLQKTENFESLAILSESDGEGKTFLTATLALAFTERQRKKVLIVDTSNADRRNAVPVPARERNTKDLLSELLESSFDVDIISLKDYKGSKEIVDEYQIKDLFNLNREKYGLILVDTSALSRKNRNNFDPLVIAYQCDASLLVSSKNDAPEGSSSENKKRILGSKIKLIGMVYNQGKVRKNESS
jgi:Mrp family chromosome partitioning ATPase